MGGTGLVAVYIKKNTDSGNLYYVCTDRQGSITALINPDGSVAEKYSYDAYGRRRNPLVWTDYNVPAPSLINRGYTGHEMLDGFGLINMNGRMYDPVIGRVLSPDIAVQAPGYTQSYNRYSYCMNNPLRYTDPSGWYTAAEINTAIDQMWGYTYGGSWTPGSGTVPYTASEGFGYYLAYNETNGWAAGSSMGSSLSSYFTSNASAVSALGFSNRVTNFDAGMQSWLLSADGLFTNYQSFVNNKTFQLVVDGNNKVVYYNSTGFVVPVVGASFGDATIFDDPRYNGLKNTANEVSTTFTSATGLMKRQLISDYKNGGDVMEILKANQQLNKLAAPAKILGKVVGVVSIAEHSYKAYNAYQQGKWGNFAINSGKLVLDGVFTFAKVSNPLFWGGAIVYGVIDYATNDY